MTRISSKQENDKYTPSVDRMFESVAKTYGRDLVAVILTGMGDDGCRGAQALHLALLQQVALLLGGGDRFAVQTHALERVFALQELVRLCLE